MASSHHAVDPAGVLVVAGFIGTVLLSIASVVYSISFNLLEAYLIVTIHDFGFECSTLRGIPADLNASSGIFIGG